VGVHRRLGVGERGPDFVLTGPSGLSTRFYAFAGGRPTALVFGRERANPSMAELTGRLAGREDVSVTAVVEPAVAEAYGVAPNQPTVVVLDPNLRVMGVVTGDNPSEAVVTLLEAAVHRGPPTQVRDQAPVLFVPRVLDAAQRDRLIRLSEHEGGRGASSAMDYRLCTGPL